MSDQHLEISGPDRAAMLLLALGEEKGALLWQQLEPDEIKSLSHAMARLGRVKEQTVDGVLNEFCAQMGEGGGITGTPETIETLLKSHLANDQASLLMQDIRGPAGRTTWDKLGNVNPQALAAYLHNEYPQTVALVLSQIGRASAARVLAALPEAFATEAVARMLSIEPIQQDIIEDVSEVLENEFLSSLGQSSQGDVYEQMAEIFNSLDRSSEVRLLTALGERDRESAERIRSLMFTFEDMLTVEAAGIQQLLRILDRGILALALKSATDQVKDLFLTNLPERAARLLREELETMGPVRIRDVEEAQNKAIQLAKELAARGEMALGPEDAHDELIE